MATVLMLLLENGYLGNYHFTINKIQEKASKNLQDLGTKDFDKGLSSQTFAT